MWRTFASLGLTFTALAWAIASAVICFFYAASFWRDVLGRFGAFYGAFAAFILCFWGAKLLLQLADKIIEPYSGPFDGSVYNSAPRDTFYKDWQRYAAEVARNRRYALYARTRQWEKLAALDGEIRAAALETAKLNSSATAVREPPAPRRTSMAGYLTPEQLRRASRRMSQSAPQRNRWAALDD